MKKYSNLLEYIRESDECEQELILVLGLNMINNITIYYNNSIKADTSKSFVRVQLVENLQQLNKKDVLNLKEKVNDMQK